MKWLKRLFPSKADQEARSDADWALQSIRATLGYKPVYRLPGEVQVILGDRDMWREQACAMADFIKFLENAEINTTNAPGHGHHVGNTTCKRCALWRDARDAAKIVLNHL